MKQHVLARRYTVSGRVQGVGFRYYVEEVAGRIGLDGFVRNRRDGRVEVYAIGKPEQLKQLRIALERGPILSYVASIQEEPDTVDATYIGNFTIEFTAE